MEELSNSSFVISDKDLRIILDKLPRVIMLIEIDGTIRYWNGGGTQVFGYTDTEVNGRNVHFLYPERSMKDFTRDLETLKKGNVISFEAEGLRKDGSMIWLDVQRVLIEDSNGKEVILGMASDITLQKKAELKLAESQARIHAILDNTIEGIITINENGIIQSFNHAAEEIFGYEVNEVVGENVSLLMPNPYSREHDRYLKNYLETGEKKIIGIGREVRGKRKDGSIFPIELSVSEVEFEGETIFTGLVRDISERRKLENEILEIAEDERRRIGQDLHDDLGQMLSGISLISRNLARKLEANGVPGADEVMEVSKMIKEADEHARNLAHGLAHIQLDKEGVQYAVQQLCSKIEKLYGAKCVFTSKNLEIEGKTHSLHLYRIVQEALHNAVKHGNAERISVRFEENKGFLQLIIEDDGTGFTNDKIQNSDGMGIRTMRYRAHILGGHLDIAETPEGLTRVICTIPVSNISVHNKNS